MMTATTEEREPIRSWISEAIRLYLEPLTKFWGAGKAALRPESSRQVAEHRVEVVLGLLLEASERHDLYRRGHSAHVQEYAQAIARVMQLPSATIELVGAAALFHDVAFLLEKYAGAIAETERLSVRQWNTIQQHPLDGAMLALSVGLGREVADVIRAHHENWNGSGYPDRLRGERIPLGARIIRFADTIDAMLCDRPYRAGLTIRDVQGELLRCRGSQFDPAIVDVVLTREAWEHIINSVPYERVPLASYITSQERRIEEEIDNDVSQRPASLRLLA